MATLLYVLYRAYFFGGGKPGRQLRQVRKLQELFMRHAHDILIDDTVTHCHIHQANSGAPFTPAKTDEYCVHLSLLRC
jgi:hypothetical protein